MKTHASYHLTSENRRTSMMSYANGMEFAWEPLMADIKNGTFDPKNHDMLHAFNWIRRHFKPHLSGLSGQQTLEREAASTAFCALYPYAPKGAQTQLEMILKDASFQHNLAMKENPQPWFDAISLAWKREESMSLWNVVFPKIGAPIKEIPLTTDNLKHALILLGAHLQSWLSQPFQRPMTEMMYDSLQNIAKPTLQTHLQTYRLLYPDMDEMPKAKQLGNFFSNVNTSENGGASVFLACGQQMASNLMLLHQNTTSAPHPVSVDLPANAFEPQP